MPNRHVATTYVVEVTNSILAFEGQNSLGYRVKENKRPRDLDTLLGHLLVKTIYQ